MRLKERILRLLHENAEGLGYNQLRQRHVHPKSINACMPELIENGLVKMKEVKVQGGMRHVYVLTPNGVAVVKRDLIGKKIVKNFKRLYDTYLPEEKLKIVSGIFRDIFESFVWRGSLENIRNFHNAIESGVKDFLNNDLFDLKKKEMVSLFKSKGMEQRGFGGWYHDPSYGIRVMRVGFILKDSKIAWELGHYLNSHHVYLLTKLGILPLTKIEDKNKKWLQEHKLSRDDAIKREMRHRTELFKQQFPEFINFVPSDYGIFSKDIR